ncbi:MAG: cytochrome c-type biogenesis protein CcmH [Actinomycetota bacterium]
MPARVRLLAWVAVVAAALSLSVVAAVDDGGAETDAERIERLSDSFACPECRGQSVAESNAAVAATIRQFIADSVTAGATDTEIRDQLVASYEARVLLNPPADGFASLIWVLPVVLVVLGAVGVGAAITGNRGRDREVSDEDLELLARARSRSGGDHS